MHVLMTADTVGGVWTYALDLCAGLLRAEGEVTGVTLVTMGDAMSHAQHAAVAAAGGAVVGEGSGGGNGEGLEVVETEYKLEWMDDPWEDVARAGKLLLETAERVEPDVVHLNGFAHASLPWRERTAAPVVVVGHSCVETWWRAVKGTRPEPGWGRYRATVRRGMHDADVFIAPTQAMSRAFDDCYGLPRDCRVIHNGRDGSLYRAGKDVAAQAPGAHFEDGRQDACATTPRDETAKQPLVLAAGRLWDEAKNLAALEAAAPRMDWPVYVAGASRGPSRRTTLGGAVMSLGSLSPAELASWMRRAAIYALPAKYEPFGLSAVEAAMAGCALVLGDIPTLREVWADAAVYVDPHDPEQLATVINEFVGDTARRTQLAARAAERAERYTATRMSRDYLKLYNELIGKGVAQ